MAAERKGPADFLKTIIGRPVVVKLNSGVDYRGDHGALCRPRSFQRHLSPRLIKKRVWFAGVLACLDGYMNIAMEQTEEYVNGQLKAKYGDTFIRGNNGMPMRPPFLCTGCPLTLCAFHHCSPVHQHPKEALVTTTPHAAWRESAPWCSMCQPKDPSPQQTGGEPRRCSARASRAAARPCASRTVNNKLWRTHFCPSSTHHGRLCCLQQKRPSWPESVPLTSHGTTPHAPLLPARLRALSISPPRTARHVKCMCSMGMAMGHGRPPGPAALPLLEPPCRQRKLPRPLAALPKPHIPLLFSGRASSSAPPASSA